MPCVPVHEWRHLIAVNYVNRYRERISQIIAPRRKWAPFATFIPSTHRVTVLADGAQIKSSVERFTVTSCATMEDASEIYFSGSSLWLRIAITSRLVVLADKHWAREQTFVCAPIAAKMERYFTERTSSNRASHVSHGNDIFESSRESRVELLIATKARSLIRFSLSSPDSIQCCNFVFIGIATACLTQLMKSREIMPRFSWMKQAEGLVTDEISVHGLFSQLRPL